MLKKDKKLAKKKLKVKINSGSPNGRTTNWRLQTVPVSKTNTVCIKNELIRIFDATTTL